MKVFVGMSGGVDSSTTAALLKKAGHDVVGVFIRVWEPPNFTCTWREDRRDAMRVCALLNIPFTTVDLSDEYKKEVVDYMIAEYEIGRTPNPDIFCNKYIKFGAFFNWAINNGADMVATGHYARQKEEAGRASLFMGLDENKDQSYFLWTIKQEQLQKTLFPVGEYKKDKVRALAKKFKLPTASKKDSQGLCFIGKLNVRDFLKDFINEEEGNVLNETGKVIGKHDGAFFFTLGQRHGFTIDNKKTNNKPYFITAKNTENNTITVSQNIKSSQNTRNKITINSLNWINKKPEIKKTYQARFRYRQDLIDIEILSLNENEAEIKLSKKELVPAGQSLVIYDGEECLGGGIIS